MEWNMLRHISFGWLQLSCCAAKTYHRKSYKYKINSKLSFRSSFSLRIESNSKQSVFWLWQQLEMSIPNRPMKMKMNLVNLFYLCFRNEMRFECCLKLFARLKNVQISISNASEKARMQRLENLWWHSIVATMGFLRYGFSCALFHICWALADSRFWDLQQTRLHQRYARTHHLPPHPPNTLIRWRSVLLLAFRIYNQLLFTNK